VSLKVAVVGCGKIADGHVEEIAKLPKLASVVAVCDREPLMAEQLAMRYGIARHYGELQTLLERERPDVVHITTPPQSHLALAVQAMDAGCHVYVEKPLTLCHADSQRLVEHAERTGRWMTVGYTYLFDPPALALRELVERGTLGDVVHVESIYGYDLSGAFGRALLSDATHWVHGLPGRLFHNNIDHLVNKLLEFVDDERPLVMVDAWTRREERFGDARDALQDELRVLVRGSRVSAHGMFSAHARPVMHTLRVFGTRNTASADFVARTVVLESAQRIPSAVGRLLPAFSSASQFTREGLRNLRRFARSDFQFFAGLNQLFSRYYQSILDGTPPPIPHRDILRASWLLDEIFAQARARVAQP
jgi:predicted dehydrogenase